MPLVPPLSEREKPAQHGRRSTMRRLQRRCQPVVFLYLVSKQSDYRFDGEYAEGGSDPHHDCQAANRSLYEIPPMLRKGIFSGPRHACQNRGKIGETRGNKILGISARELFFSELFFPQRWRRKRLTGPLGAARRLTIRLAPMRGLRASLSELPEVKHDSF